MNTIYVNKNSLKSNACKLHDIATNMVGLKIKNMLHETQSLYDMFPEIKNMLLGLEYRFDNAVNDIIQLSNCLQKISDKYASVDEELVYFGNCIKNAFEIANPTDATPEDGKSAEERRQEFVDNYDYTYYEDNIAVPINIEFLDKNTCLIMAERIIAEHGEDGMCNGMNKKRIAKELYAHAIGYYTGTALEGYGIDGDLVQSLMESGEVADIGLGDGLDTHYNLIWWFMDPFKLVD
ncbi:MAG: hypothetical protein HDT40_00810 [Lachnospiraceae bacterium]|nr:hypothetical protein [Lachnospiraceae bacterium]